jgi:hypothetical protein
MNQLEVKSKDGEGKEVVVFVKRPTSDQLTQAQMYSNKVFREALESGAILRVKLDDYMESQGLWDEEQQKKLKELDTKIDSNLKKLRNGKAGKLTKLSQARKLALDIRKDRMERLLLLSKKRELDEYTVEAQAENARFNKLVTLCVYNDEDEYVFSDLTDYNNKKDEPYAVEAASKLATILYQLDEDWQKKLPENEFLLKHKFVDDKLRLINKDGHLVTEDDKLVNENGEYVDGDGNKITRDGQKVDDNGNIVVDGYVEFEDDLT